MWWSFKQTQTGPRLQLSAKAGGQRTKRTEQVNINSTHPFVSICSTNLLCKEKISFIQWHYLLNTSTMTLSPQKYSSLKGASAEIHLLSSKRQSMVLLTVFCLFTVIRLSPAQEELHTRCYTLDTKLYHCSPHSKTCQTKLNSHIKKPDLQIKAGIEFRVYIKPIIWLSTKKTSETLNVGSSNVWSFYRCDYSQTHTAALNVFHRLWSLLDNKWTINWNYVISVILFMRTEVLVTLYCMGVEFTEFFSISDFQGISLKQSKF